MAIVKLEGRRQSLFEEYARLERSEGRRARTEDFRLLAGSGSGSSSGFASKGNPRVNGGGGVASSTRRDRRASRVRAETLARRSRRRRDGGADGGADGIPRRSRRVGGGGEGDGANRRAGPPIDRTHADEPSSGGSSIERVAAEMEGFETEALAVPCPRRFVFADPAAEEKATIERLHRECAVIGDSNSAPTSDDDDSPTRRRRRGRIVARGSPRRRDISPSP